jgi:hypothetical protein
LRLARRDVNQLPVNAVFGAMKKCLLLLACVAGSLSASYAGDTARVLFIGNSYTNVNNLPQLIKDVAASAGDVVIKDENTPGSTTFETHSADPVTLGKIAQGGWDYVVLQEQSQRPAFSDAQVEADVYPYAKLLDSLIIAGSPCAETIFYMTWGRKNGDAGNCAAFPPICTYSGMDSLLRIRYQKMANDNHAVVSPVGAVWRRLRGTNPGIELFNADESHPSVAGSYAAACAFYSVMFAKNPMNITSNAGVSPADAATIRAAAKAVVFDSLLYWKVGAYTPPAGCTSPASVGDVKAGNDISIVVNNRQLVVSSEQALAAGTELYVTALDGRVVARRKLGTAAREVIVALPDVAAGMYVVKVGNELAKRVVIQ